MAITREDVIYTARLARIALSEEEIEKFTVQLDRIIEFIDKLKEADVKGVEPMTEALGEKNRVRKDIQLKSFDRETILRTAPDRDDNFFKVPPVIEDK